MADLTPSETRVQAQVFLVGDSSAVWTSLTPEQVLDLVNRTMRDARAEGLDPVFIRLPNDEPEGGDQLVNPKAIVAILPPEGLPDELFDEDEDDDGVAG